MNTISYVHHDLTTKSTKLKSHKYQSEKNHCINFFWQNLQKDQFETMDPSEYLYYRLELFNVSSTNLDCIIGWHLLNQVDLAFSKLR